MTRITARSSTIFIATGDTTRIYRSMSDVPVQLRRKLQESTSGINSATILIADKRGREELVKALQRRPPEAHGCSAGSIMPRQPVEKPKAQRSLMGPLRTWLELLIPVAIGASLWLLIGSRF